MVVTRAPRGKRPLGARQAEQGATVLALALALALGLGLALAYWAWANRAGHATERGVVDAACDLDRAPCLARFADGTWVEVSLAPRPLPVQAALALRVVVSGQRPGAVRLDFSGERMNMGLLRAELARGADGAWSGTVTLPACVTGRMTWRAELDLAGAGRRRVAAWRFDAGGQ